MRKLLGFFALAMALLVTPITAQADTIMSWDLDLTPWGGGVTTDIVSISASGEGTITQDFGGDGILSVGDTFTADSVLFAVSLNTGSGKVFEPFVDVSPDADKLYFWSDNLAGEITSVDGGGAFTYAYTSGDVALYAGEYNNPVASTLITSFDLTFGQGEGADSDLGGNFLQGDTDIVAEFDTNPLTSGLISFDPAAYPALSGYPSLSTFFVFDLNNNLLPGINNPQFTGNGFIADFETSGTISLVATPEPSTFVILGLGLLGLIGFRRKFNF